MVLQNKLLKNLTDYSRYEQGITKGCTYCTVNNPHVYPAMFSNTATLTANLIAWLPVLLGANPTSRQQFGNVIQCNWIF